MRLAFEVKVLLAHLALQGDALVVEHGREAFDTTGVRVQRLQQVRRATSGEVVRFCFFHIGAGRVTELRVANLLHGHVALAQDNDGIACVLFHGRFTPVHVIVIVATACERIIGQPLFIVVDCLDLALRAWGVHLQQW